MDEQFLQQRRAQRARERRRRARRRRIGAVAALGAVVAIVVVAVVLATSGGGGTSSHSSGGAAVAARRAAQQHAARTTAQSSDAALGLGPGTGRPGDATAPILMYHVIAPPPTGAPFPGLYVPADEFAAQMQALHDAGWHAITLNQLRANWTRGLTLPSKPFVITFDNGYHSQYASALPVLRRLRWVADENIQLTGLPPSQGGLTDAEIRGLVGAGWELDTQGISHADLITLNAADLHAQVAGARQTIQRRFHVPVRWFCYPSGHYDATVIAAVKAAGYVGSTTVVPGWASRGSDPDRLPRLRVIGGTSPSALITQMTSTRTATAPPPSYSGT